MKIFSGSSLKFGTNMNDVQVPVALHTRASTSLPWLDEMLGSNRWGTQGFVPGTATILTGDPGAGKSTLAFTIACGLTNVHMDVCNEVSEQNSRGMTNSELSQAVELITGPSETNEAMVFYNSTEENAEQVVMRGQRLGLADSNLLLGDEPEIVNLIARMDAIIAQRREEGWTGMPVLVLDSLQSMTYNDSQSSSALATGYSLLVGWAKAQKAVFISINQVSKSGKMSGSQKVKHACDSYLHLATLSEKEMEDMGVLESGARALRTRKNRFGSTGENWIVALGETGFVPVGREVLGQGR